MRYPASEKLEIIRIVEQSHLPMRRTLEKLGVPRATFYHWYDLCRLGGIDALSYAQCLAYAPSNGEVREWLMRTCSVVGACVEPHSGKCPA
jgi:transposase-like protein